MKRLHTVERLPLNSLSVSKLDISFGFFSIALLLTLWAIPYEDILYNIGLLSVVFVVFSISYTLSRVNYFVSLFSPNFICFFYLSLSFSVGCFSAYFGYGKLLNDFIDDLKNVSNLKVITSFIYLGLLINLSIGISYAKRLEGIKSVDFYSGIANYLAPTLVVGIYTLTMLPYFLFMRFSFFLLYYFFF